MTTAGSQSGSRTRLPLLRAWWIADRGAVIRVIGLIVATVSFILLWPSLIKIGGAALVMKNMTVHLYVLAWMMLVTLGVRSVGSRDVLAAYFMGTFLVPVLVFVPLAPIIKWLGSSSETLGVVFVPPVEEGAILLSVLLFGWRLTRRVGRRPGVIDMMVVGWAIGSGFAIHEDALYGRFLASWGDRTLLGAFDMPYGLLFPTFPTGTLPGGVGGGVYHGGKGLLFGLVVGLVIVLYRRMAWIIAIVPAVWLFSTFDHGLHNYQVWNGLSPLRFLTGNGHFLAIGLFLAVPALLVFEHWRRTRVEVDLPAFGLAGIREAIRRGSGPVDTLSRLLAYGHYHRARNAVLTAMWSEPGAPVPRLAGIEAWGRLAFTPREQTAGAESNGQSQ